MNKSKAFMEMTELGLTPEKDTKDKDERPTKWWKLKVRKTDRDRE